METKNLLELAIAKTESLELDEELKDVLRSALYYLRYLTFDTIDLAEQINELKIDLRSVSRRLNDLEAYHN